MSLNVEALSRAADEARGLAMDAVQTSKSGHLGLPLGCAEMGAVLYGQALQHNPNEPRWINRDYFILSAGHGSMMLYPWLHMSGYDVSMDDIRAFRQLHSKTPGHPEFFETPGVECTTGPLGQGRRQRGRRGSRRKDGCGAFQHAGAHDFRPTHHLPGGRRLPPGRRRGGGERVRRPLRPR
jgi:hypothetical protein